jgi:zinc D-Ala-D-Ala dipeptidase
MRVRRRDVLTIGAGALASSVWAQDPEAITTPPIERGVRRKSDLVELIKLDPRLKLDIRYARKDNFTGRPVYSQPRAFLQRPAARALVRAHNRLRKMGYGLLIFDGYRPWAVTKFFWEITPPDKHDFVAKPSRGSRHNRGCAVDLSLFDLKTSQEVPMPSPYDDFTEKAAPDYAGGTPEKRRTRDILRRAMEAEGFAVFTNEWWHFDYQDWREYPIVNVPFEQL